MEFEAEVMRCLEVASVQALALEPVPEARSRDPGVSLGHRQCDHPPRHHGPAEGINSRNKTAKIRSRDSRNRERFANAIFLHLGGLDLYPDSIREWPATHQKGRRTS